MLSFEQIKELIDLVSERELQGLELERSGFKIRIDGKGQASVAPASAGPPPAAPAATPVAATPQSTPASAPAPASAAPEVATDAEGELPPGAHVVTSPIVGTFYSAPNPDAEPYAKVGDRVRKGQVLCIVEAMKLMNEIESDVDGTIVKILPKNAQPVEFGEPLFVIDPA